MSLQIESEPSQNGTMLRINGRIDASTSPKLHSELDAAISGEGSVVYCDFSGVDYLSSAGMRLMLSGAKQMKEKGKSLRFFSIREEVMEIVQMAGFEKILEIYPTEEAAKQS